jgi:hypothetical protein
VNGKLVAGFIVVIALIAGLAMYWLQEYAYYAPVVFQPGDEIELVPLSGPPEAIPVSGLQGIDAASSPLRFRACFSISVTLATLTESYQVYEGAVPLVAPSWFDCFDAGQISGALATGEAIAFLSESNINSKIDETGEVQPSGVDRVVAVFPDGRAFAWHQLAPTAEN